MRPSCMTGSSRKALLKFRELSGGPTGSPGVVGRPFQISGISWEALTNVREAILDDREWSGDPPGHLGVVGRPSWMSRSGRKALPDVWEW